MSLEIALEFQRMMWNQSLPTDTTQFKYLGAGISRQAYLCATDNRVYKYGHHSCNVSEMVSAAWLKMNRPRPGILIPQFTVYSETLVHGQSVSETDYYPNDGSVSPTDSRHRWFTRILSEVECSDTHGGNVYSYKGHLVCIDLGYSNIPNANEDDYF